MIEFESGGFEGAKPVKSTAIKLPNTAAPVNAPSDNQETGWGYIKRNAAKTPTLAYEQARTGMGLGGVLNQPGQLQEQLMPTRGMPRKPFDAFSIFGTPEQANEEAHSILTKLGAKPETAKYMTEHRPEDWPAEMLIQELPWLGAGILKSVMSGSIEPLIHYGLQTAASLGGGYVAGESAKTAAQGTGLEPQLQELAGLAGTAAGAVGAGSVARKLNMGEHVRRQAYEENQKFKVSQEHQNYRQAQANIHTATDAEIMKIAQEREAAHKQAAETREQAQGKAVEERENALGANEKTLVRSLEETEAAKNQVLTEAERDLPPKVQQLIIEERTKKEAIPLEQDAFNKDKQQSIANVEERKEAYGQEQQTLNKLVQEKAQQHEKLAGNQVSDGAALEQVLDASLENQELLAPADLTRFEKFVKTIGNKIQTGGLTLKQAKAWYKKANTMLFSNHTAPEMKAALYDVLHKEGGLHDYITKTGSPEHTKAWTEMNDAYARGAILKKGRAEFIADQNAEIAAIRAEKFGEHAKFTAKEEAKEAIAERKKVQGEYETTKKKAVSKAETETERAKRKHKQETEDIEEQHAKAKTKANESEAKAKTKADEAATKAKEKAETKRQEDLAAAEQSHNDAQEAIGKETYEDFMQDLEKDDATRHKILNMSEHGMSRWTAAALGMMFGSYKMGLKGGALLGAAGQLASKAARELRLTRRVLSEHPYIYKEMMATVKKSMKRDAAHALIQFNKLGNKIERYAGDYKEEQEPVGIEFEAGGYG